MEICDETLLVLRPHQVFWEEGARGEWREGDGLTEGCAGCPQYRIL